MTAASTPWQQICTQPYRLFFLGAAVHAALHVLAWTLWLTIGGVTIAGNPFLWHGYELVFGFGGALISGFLLTASANWTNRRTVTPMVLFALLGAWLIARIGALSGATPWLVAIADGVLFWGLFLALTRVLILAGSRRNYRFIPLIGLLALAATGTQLAAAGVVPDWRYPLLNGAVDLLLILMVIMGGRVIPFFTSRRLPNLSVENPEWLGNLASGLVVLSVIAVRVFPEHIAAMLTWFAACFLLARLIHWSPLGTRHVPLLWILHLGYFWLVLALFLRGGALAWDWLPLATTLHAIAVGGMGCLSLGMMARVALGHSGRALEAPRWLVPAFVLVAVAPILRLAAAWPGVVDTQFAYALAGGAWTLAFGIYAIGYLPILLGPRQDEAMS